MLCRMLLRLLPLVTGLAPIFAVNASFLVAVDAGVLSACNPYFDGCTSISATGRYPPSSYLFKGVMAPDAIVLAVYWVFSVAWLRSLEKAAGMASNAGTWVGVLGIGGALSLILYVTFLGSDGDFYEFMRRFGVYLYFALNVFAQLILAPRVIRLANALQLPVVLRITKWQLGLALIPFVLGALNLVLKAILDDAKQFENAIEWTFAILMHVYFLLSYISWRATGFTASFATTLETDR